MGEFAGSASTDPSDSVCSTHGLLLAALLTVEICNALGFAVHSRLTNRKLDLHDRCTVTDPRLEL